MFLEIAKKKLSGFARLSQQEGFLHALRKVMNICLSAFYYQQRIIYLRHTLGKEVPIRETRGQFKWRLARKKDFKQLEEFYQPTSSKQTPASRYQRGDFCLIALDDQRIIHMSWCALKEIDILEIEKIVSIEHGIACCYNVLTHPDYRGRGVLSAGICRLGNILSKRGFREMFIYVRDDNNPSLIGIRKAKYEPYLDEKMTRLLWMRFYKKREIKNGYEGLIQN